MARASRAGSSDAVRPTILLVDDEPDILESYQRLLEHVLEARVLTAASPREGLKLLNQVHVDAVVSDFKMPEMNGLEFLSRVRTIEPGLPVLLFTAFADAQLEDQAVRRFGHNIVVSKHDDPRSVLRRVQELVAGPHSGARPSDPGRKPPGPPGSSREQHGKRGAPSPSFAFGPDFAAV